MAVTLCGQLIANNIAPDCDRPMFSGLEDIAYIINKKDWDAGTVVYDGTNPHIITSISLVSPAKAYQVYNPVKNPFNGTSVALNSGDNVNKLDNKVSFMIMDNGPVVSQDIIEPIKNGKFVMIIENTREGVKGKFEIMGLEKGLKLSALSRNHTDEGTDGCWTVEMSETGVTVAPTFVFDTDVATTRALLNGLLV